MKNWLYRDTSDDLHDSHYLFGEFIWFYRVFSEFPGSYWGLRIGDSISVARNQSGRYSIELGRLSITADWDPVR